MGSSSEGASSGLAVACLAASAFARAFAYACIFLLVLLAPLRGEVDLEDLAIEVVLNFGQFGQ